MIEQHAPAIIAASAALNALWLLGAFLTTRRSKRRWLWRAGAGDRHARDRVDRAFDDHHAATIAHPAGPRSISTSARLAWHVMLPVALLAMALRVLWSC